MAKEDSTQALAPITITRTFSQPIEKVFSFWSSAEQFKKWWKPEGFKLVNANVESQIGGEYSFELQTPDGQLMMQYGQFHEITPPTKLVFTNKCEARDGCEQETVITVAFAKKGPSATELSVRHEFMPTQSCRDQAQRNWSSVLDGLAKELAKPS